MILALGILVGAWLVWGTAVALVAGVVGFVLARHVRARRIWVAAFVEQGRREATHHSAWRHDQRVHAIQQRLARHLGRRRAFSVKNRKRIEKELGRGLESK